MGSSPRIVDVTSGRVVARVEMAETPLRRTIGLLGRRGLGADEAMVLEPCNSVHTWFMRFPIDVVFVSREGEVLKTREHMGPFRFAYGTRRTQLTIELPAGACRRSGLTVGSRVRVDRS